MKGLAGLLFGFGDLTPPAQHGVIGRAIHPGAVIRVDSMYEHGEWLERNQRAIRDLKFERELAKRRRRVAQAAARGYGR